VEFMTGKLVHFKNIARPRCLFLYENKIGNTLLLLSLSICWAVMKIFSKRMRDIFSFLLY